MLCSVYYLVYCCELYFALCWGATANCYWLYMCGNWTAKVEQFGRYWLLHWILHCCTCRVVN